MLKNNDKKSMLKKICKILLALAFLVLIISAICESNAYAIDFNRNATSISESVAEVDKNEIAKQPIISIETIAEIVDKNIEEEQRERKSKVLLLKQPFDLKTNKDDEYFIMSQDKELVVLKDGRICGTKVGKYNLTVFYFGIGVVDYVFEIRDAATESPIKVRITKGEELKLDVQNADLATYGSSNEDIVTVESDGTIKSKKTGQAIITATINDFQKIEYHIDSRPTFDYYSDEELSLIYAIIQQECATSYEGALAVISCAYNRSITSSFAYFGQDPLSQLKGKNQFCYSLDNHWERYLIEGTVHDYVKQAVYDCLYLGKTNHDFLSFRSFQTEGSVEFDGNHYFNMMNN